MKKTPQPSAARRWSYRDREEAGQVLGAEVLRVVGGRAVVAAIPRGGIVVAAPVAHALRAPLTLAYVRKLTLPGNPELAIGALDEDGQALFDEGRPGFGSIPAPLLAEARRYGQAEIDRQRACYRAPPLASLAVGAAVVLVDDGLATGLTMRAAVEYAQRHGAREIVVAVPCASIEAADVLRREADRFLCPWVDPGFMAVGAYYDEFQSVSDAEVTRVLELGHRGLETPGSGLVDRPSSA